MPKSVTVAFPSAPTITLLGLKSLWTIPLRWAKPAPSRIWRTIRTASVGASPALISCWNERPSSSSIAM